MDIEGAIHDGWLVLRDNNNLLNKDYLYHILSSPFVYNQFSKLAKGSTVKNLNINLVSTVRINLFPLPEQRAIVSKIEQLFTELDKGISDLKKAQEQLKIYRQAVLKKAFEGNFNIDTSNRDRKFIKLGTVIEKPQYGTSKKCTEKKHGRAVLRIPNIKKGQINTEVLKYALFNETELESIALKDGDILTIRSNGSIDLVGKCALITKKDIDYLYAGYLIRLRPIQEKMIPKYLLYCLSSHELRVQIESKAKSTSGVNNINSKELQDLKIPIYHVEEQHQIVREIESRLSICDKIEENIKEGLTKAEALRQSILKKAFEGKLLSKDEIERCKQEADYEPASELLRKIKENK